MDTNDPAAAQQVVSEYAAVLERHADANVYPAPLAALPHSKETIKASIRTSAAALARAGLLTSELRDFLEVAYIALADYVEDDLMRLMREYNQAGAELAADARLAGAKVGTPAWQQLTSTSRLAGEIAKTLAEETERLRREFREFSDSLSPTA
jgi:hypothetical protein